MTEESPRRGKTTIAPDVLLTIAKLSALGVPGVAQMSPVPGGVNRLFRRGIGDGVRIEVKDQSVAVDLYLVVKNDVNVREASRADERRRNREAHVRSVVTLLESKCREAGIEATVTGRSKHLAGIYQKMNRQEIDFDQARL